MVTAYTAMADAAVERAAGTSSPPLEHLVDQHTYRGIGHVLLLADGERPSFKARFELVFGEVTGLATSRNISEHTDGERRGPVPI